MPFRSADMPVQVRFTVFPVRPGECDLFVVPDHWPGKPGTDRNPRCTPVLSSLRHTPRGVDFINICGHFSKVVIKSDSWKNIFKNFPGYSRTEHCDDKQIYYLIIRRHVFSARKGV